MLSQNTKNKIPPFVWLRATVVACTVPVEVSTVDIETRIAFGGTHRICRRHELSTHALFYHYR